MRIVSNRITIRGKPVDFAYLDSENLKTAVADIVQGREYPLMALPGYSPRVVVDVGANVGAAALFFYSAWPDASYHCFEPAKDCYDCLARNVKGFANIHAHHFGLYDKDCEMPLFKGFEQPAQNSVVAYAGTSDDSETVVLKDAEAALAALDIGDISILKLDTEGCEVPILKSIAGRLGAIDLVYLEYHCEADRRELDALLASRFDQIWARAERMHTGRAIYIARPLAARWPELEISKIPRPGF